MISTTWLKQSELFGSLQEPQLDIILSHSSIESLAPGKIIFRQGEEATHLYLLIDGAVDLSVKTADQTQFMTSQVQKEGAVFGIPSLIEPFRYNVTAKSLTATKVLQIEAAQLRKSMEENPRMGMEIMRKLASTYFTRLNDLRMGVTKFFKEFPSKKT